jgi:hypothetical protein
MLGRGQALAGMPYQAYMGPLTAGQSTLQDTAFQGLAGLNIPTNQQMTYNPMSFTGMAPTAPTAQQTVTGGLGSQQGQMPNQMLKMIDTTSHLGDYFGEGAPELLLTK